MPHTVLKFNSKWFSVKPKNYKKPASGREVALIPVVSPTANKGKIVRDVHQRIMLLNHQTRKDLL